MRVSNQTNERTNERFFVCNYVLCLYLARDKRWYLVSFQAIVDVVTIVPSYAVLPLEVRSAPQATKRDCTS